MHNPDRSPPIKNLITLGLNYCCLWAFFSLYSKTDVIADRLGCERRVVQEWKKRFREGGLRCTDCERCMYEALVKAGKVTDRRRFDRGDNR
jgi:hypothetical protein